MGCGKLHFGRITMKPQLTPLELDLLSLSGTSRDSRIVARHFGFDGRGGANFRVIGDEVGLTRERVRQIVLQSGARRRYRGARLAALNPAIALIASSLPDKASEVEERLRAAGLTSGRFRLEGIVNAAKLTGHRVPFSIAMLEHESFVVTPGFKGFSTIRMRAREKVRQCGMASVAELLPDNQGPDAARRERNFTEAVLSAEKELRWLDGSREWFWFSDAKGNLALRRIRKMLCVSNPLRIGDLRAGLARISNTLPSDEVLLAFCRQAPGIIVEGDSIRPDLRMNFDDVLNPTELDRGGCMSNSELICRANDLGIKRPTFYQCVSQSPIVSRTRGHYELLGSRVQTETTLATRLRA
jgi:hypothetical protein